MDEQEELRSLNHFQLRAAQQKQKEARDIKYRERSKKRLVSIISTKIKTSFIGAIAAFEDGFGFLWGHDKDDLTEDEQAMQEIWESVRARILDNGNGQLRGAINEIQNNSVHWDRFHVDVPIQSEGNEETK